MVPEPYFFKDVDNNIFSTGNGFSSAIENLPVFLIFFDSMLNKGDKDKNGYPISSEKYRGAFPMRRTTVQ